MAKLSVCTRIQNMAMKSVERYIGVSAVTPAVVKRPIYETFIDPYVHKTTGKDDSFC